MNKTIVHSKYEHLSPMWVGRYLQINYWKICHAPSHLEVAPAAENCLKSLSSIKFSKNIFEIVFLWSYVYVPVHMCVYISLRRCCTSVQSPHLLFTLIIYENLQSSRISQHNTALQLSKHEVNKRQSPLGSSCWWTNKLIVPSNNWPADYIFV